MEIHLNCVNQRHKNRRGALAWEASSLALHQIERGGPVGSSARAWRQGAPSLGAPSLPGRQPLGHCAKGAAICGPLRRQGGRGSRSSARAWRQGAPVLGHLSQQVGRCSGLSVGDPLGQLMPELYQVGRIARAATAGAHGRAPGGFNGRACRPAGWLAGWLGAHAGALHQVEQALTLGWKAPISQSQTRN